MDGKESEGEDHWRGCRRPRPQDMAEPVKGHFDLLLFVSSVVVPKRLKIQISK